MPDSLAHQPTERRLRRWWRGFLSTLEDMQTSGHEHLADRIDDIEERLRRLEAMQPAMAVEPAAAPNPR